MPAYYITTMVDVSCTQDAIAVTLSYAVAHQRLHNNHILQNCKGFLDFFIIYGVKPVVKPNQTIYQNHQNPFYRAFCSSTIENTHLLRSLWSKNVILFGQNLFFARCSLYSVSSL